MSFLGCCFFFGGGGGGGGGIPSLRVLLFSCNLFLLLFQGREEYGQLCRWYHLMWLCEVEIAHREAVEADLMMLLQAMIIKSLPKYCPALTIKYVCTTD